MAELRCTVKACQRLVTQGRYYCKHCPDSLGTHHTGGRSHGNAVDCAECDKNLCEDCYRQGQACDLPDAHRLYVYLRANVDQSKPDLATDGINCASCKLNMKQGPVYSA